MEKQFYISLISRDDDGKIRFHFNNPLALLLILLIFSMVSSFIFLAAKQVTDSYYSYEGKVIKIEKKWYDNFLFETSDDEHLIIETSSGEVIDRYVNQFDRISNRIEKGDKVIKMKGFGEEVRAVGKKTMPEMMEELGKLKKGN